MFVNGTRYNYAFLFITLFPEVVPLAYIMAGVAAGVLLIVIVSIVVILCRRRKSRAPSGK